MYKRIDCHASYHWLKCPHDKTCLIVKGTLLYFQNKGYLKITWFNPAAEKKIRCRTATPCSHRGFVRDLEEAGPLMGTFMFYEDCTAPAAAYKMFKRTQWTFINDICSPEKFIRSSVMNFTCVHHTFPSMYPLPLFVWPFAVLP